MTCEEFGQRADRHIAGDVVGAVDDDVAMLAHAVTCSRCGSLLRSVRALRAPTAMPSLPAGDGGRRATRRLRDQLARTGRPSVRFGSVETPIGRLFVGASERGIYDVTFDARDEGRYIARLARRACDVTADRHAVAAALEELSAYFAGELMRFTVPVDLSGVTDFTARVLRATRRIPFGRIRSYGEIAHRIGSPRASRAVGGALGRNPVPILIPCHRVIAGGGGIGGYTGGLPTKRALLRIEGHAVSATVVRKTP